VDISFDAERFLPVTANQIEGARIMREIVARAINEEWVSGPLSEFAFLRFGIPLHRSPYDNESDPIFGCCGAMCSMSHHSPDPCSASARSWLVNGKAFDDVAKCSWYRASFGWGVARARMHMAELCDASGIAFTMCPDTGAIVAPDQYRPEDAFKVGGERDERRIMRVHVTREPRAYMDEPTWWPKPIDYDANTYKPKKKISGRVFECVRFLGPVVVWIEYESPIDGKGALRETHQQGEGMLSRESRWHESTRVVGRDDSEDGTIEVDASIGFIESLPQGPLFEK